MNTIFSIYTGNGINLIVLFETTQSIAHKVNASMFLAIEHPTLQAFTQAMRNNLIVLFETIQSIAHKQVRIDRSPVLPKFYKNGLFK